MIEPTTTRNGSGGAVRIEIPDEVADRFRTLAETKAGIERALGRVMDDWISELPTGYHETAFELFQRLYYDTTGHWREIRTLQFWRTCATRYTAAELEELHPLSDAQLNKAVELAINCTDGTTAADIGRWAIANGINKVPPMVEHWAKIDKQPGIEAPLPGWMQAIERYLQKQFPPTHAFYPRWQEFFKEVKQHLQ